VDAASAEGRPAYHWGHPHPVGLLGPPALQLPLPGFQLLMLQTVKKTGT
jgi:hypothetical protein